MTGVDWPEMPGPDIPVRGEGPHIVDFDLLSVLEEQAQISAHSVIVTLGTIPGGRSPGRVG